VTAAVAQATGLASIDAQTDFNRARRRRALAGLARWLRREPSDVDVILPFEEVVEALGKRTQRSLGLQVIAVDSIVGTVDRGHEFDRDFRPMSGRLRTRWERISMAQRRGQHLPPISVYRIGDLHFVDDGHHRVSVARALGQETIDAYVTEVMTQLRPGHELHRSDLPLKGHERLFNERVPLPPEALGRIQLTEPEWQYAGLAENVEAWGFRAMQHQHRLMTRAEVADAWFREEYEPAVEMLRDADLLGRLTETEAYLRLATERYLLLRTHAWNDGVIERLQEALA
jgi:hypothetical protein